MPPQNSTRPSTTHSLRCRRRQRLGSSRPNRPSGEYTRHCTPAAVRRAAQGRQAAGAYTVHHQMRAHAALRRTGQRFAHAAPAPVKSKM